jgi:hypothetical protein
LKKIPSPDERDKCLSQIIFLQKNKKMIFKALMATVSSSRNCGWGMLTSVKHLLPGSGHAMAILTAGRPAHLLVTLHAVKVVGSFQPGLIYMIKMGIIQFTQVLFAETLPAVTVAAGNGVGFPAFGVTADTVGISDLVTRGMMMTLSAACYLGVHGVIKVHSVIEFGQTVDFHCFRCVRRIHGPA